MNKFFSYHRNNQSFLVFSLIVVVILFGLRDHD